MALRARLTPPSPQPRQDWPWHTAKVGSIAVSALLRGDRRMEAETYLSSGYGIRTAIESKPSGWVKLHRLARSWQPSRLKGIQVPKDVGTPFLAATQVFDFRPVPRKWLALARTSDSANRFVQPGTILITCSGSVGRPTLATGVLRNILVSHDLLRIDPHAAEDRGWVYAYLLASQTRAMTQSMHYGHIIKHLETSHLDELPVPTVDRATAQAFEQKVQAIIALRDEAHQLSMKAEERFAAALGGIPSIEDWGESGFTVHASSALVSGRRRFEATIHNPGVAAIRRHLAAKGRGFTTIRDTGYKAWLPTRFKRIPAKDGVWLFESSDLTEINPQQKKRIADGNFGDPHRGRVSPGWILLARSGQTYGILGTAVLSGEDLAGKVVSDHIIRIRPTDTATVAAGYMCTVLAHPVFGRPLLKALAYGSSIPEIEVADVETFEIVRLEKIDEAAIAELAERSADAKAEADLLEQSIADEASRIIERFLKRASD